MLVKRKRRNNDYKVRGVCFVCRAANITVGPQHVIPREEGGLPLADNIVQLCEVHHNLVEGPYGSFYDGRQGWGKIYAARADWEAEHRPQPKARLDCRVPEPPRLTKEEESRTARFEILWQRSRKGCGAFSGFWTKEQEKEYFDLIGMKSLARETEKIAA